MSIKTSSKYWQIKNDNYLKSSKVSIARKVLTYLIYIRPLLNYYWFQRNCSQIKQLEIKALQNIFKKIPATNLYEQFSDVNVTRYHIIEQIKKGKELQAYVEVLYKECFTQDPKIQVTLAFFFTRAGGLGGGQCEKICYRRRFSLRAHCASQQCAMVDVKSLLEGCDRLTGLNVTGVGGTMVNDHNCDVLLPKQVFTDEPLFQYPRADSKKFYTILMIDPDASPKIEGEFYLHMLKSNIPGLALKAKEISKTVGIDYRGYKPPTPPRGSGAHRYMSVLYEQTDGNNFLPSVPSSRGRFHLSNWLRNKSLCGPVAGTQFRVQF